MPHPQPIPSRRAAAAALLLRALRVDARRTRDVVERAATDGAPPREVARRLVVRSARRGAVVGFVCGLPPHPALRLPAAGVEGLVALRARLALAARLSYLRDPSFLEQPAWEARVVKDLVARRARAPLDLSAPVRALGLALGGRAARWTVEQVTRRALPRAVPVLGAVLGGVAAHRDLRRFGEALVDEGFGR